MNENTTIRELLGRTLADMQSAEQREDYKEGIAIAQGSSVLDQTVVDVLIDYFDDCRRRWRDNLAKLEGNNVRLGDSRYAEYANRCDEYGFLNLAARQAFSQAIEERNKDATEAFVAGLNTDGEMHI